MNLKKKVLIIIITLFILSILLFGLYLLFKFKNVEIELGDNTLNLQMFIRYGSYKKCVIDTKNVHFNEVGEYDVTLKYLGINFKRKVSIVDTTPPILETIDVSKEINYEFNVDDFVLSSDDKSKYEISYEGDIDTTKYGEYDVSVIAKDIYDNKTVKHNKLYISWTRLQYEVEVGDTIAITDLVFKKEDKKTINQEELDKINSSREGNYELKTTKDNQELIIKIVKTKDVTPPELTLKNVTIYEGKEVKGVNDFVKKAFDKAGKVELKLLTKIDYKKIGEQKIQIEATDEEGNSITKDTKLKIVKDTKGPVFKGLGKITINKNQKIDYNKGVSAYDDNFGNSSFTVDSSNVNTSKYGTYHAVYTAVDKLGNKTTAKRVIVVNHDKSDTDALVKKVAATLSSDAEMIRDYVRTNVKYSHNSGGSDPTWQGLTNHVGDCIVHAYVFQALLKEKGYSTKLIWTTDKTHYWNMVYLNGKWVHMDSTPGDRHTKYSIMNDEQRYERLQGRDWNRSLWPKAE